MRSRLSWRQRQSQKLSPKVNDAPHVQQAPVVHHKRCTLGLQLSQLDHSLDACLYHVIDAVSGGEFPGWHGSREQEIHQNVHVQRGFAQIQQIEVKEAERVVRQQDKDHSTRHRRPIPSKWSEGEFPSQPYHRQVAKQNGPQHHQLRRERNAEQPDDARQRSLDQAYGQRRRQQQQK